MLRRYYGKVSRLPIDQFVGHDGELVVDDQTGNVYVMDGVTYGGIQLGTGNIGGGQGQNVNLGNLVIDDQTIYGLNSNASIYITGNVVTGHLDATSFHSTTGINNGFSFIDEAHNTISKIYHSNLFNNINIIHEGNIGVSVYANGATQINHVILKNVETFTTFLDGVNFEKAANGLKFKAFHGLDNGYKFVTPDGNILPTALVHNDATNQVQLIHEGNAKISLNSNGSLQTSNIIINQDHITASDGIIYVNDIPLSNNGYVPIEPNNWVDIVNITTISAALDELALRITALQNYDIDGGNAFTEPTAEFEIDGGVA